MATRTVSDAGGNYNVGTTWVGGVVPSTTDTIEFTATSGNLTVNVASTISAIDFTNCVSTLTMTASLTVNGNVTLANTMTIAGSSSLIINATTSTLTSNGKVWPNDLFIRGTSSTHTLADNWVVNGSLSIGIAAQTIVINGFSISVGVDFTTASSAVCNGTCNIILVGTGTWGWSGSNCTLPITINTAGTITVSDAIIGNTFLHISGNVVCTGTISLTNTPSSSYNITSNTIVWNNMRVLITTSNTITLLDNLNIDGNLVVGANSNTQTVNGTINLKGDFSSPNSNTIFTGTGALNFIGTGTQTWSASSTLSLRKNTNVNKPSGNFTISGLVSYNTGTFTYITSGSVTTTGSTLNIGASTTLDTNGITWVNLTTSATATITLSSNLTLTGIWSSTAGTVTFAGVGIISLTGSISFTSSSRVTIPNSITSLTTITINSNNTTTLVGDLTASGLVTLGSGSNNTTISSSGGSRTITCNNGYTNGSTSGGVICNCNIKVTGGTITGNTANNTNVVIVGGYTAMGSTYIFELAGNITFATTNAFYIGGATAPNAGTFKYTSGTITTTGSYIFITAINLDLPGISFNNLWLISFLSSNIIVLQSDIQVNGLLTLGLGTSAQMGPINNNGTTKTITTNGGISLNGTTAIVSGTANIKCTGGTITGASTVQLRNNLTIDTTGTITISGNVYYNTGTLTYTSGTVIPTGSTLTIGASTTLNTSGMTWDNITITSGIQTLLSDLNCQNLTSASATINGFNVNVNGNLTANGLVLKGTSTIVLTGTGLWTATNASNTFRTPIVINTNGIITLANSLYHDGDLTYIKGIVKSNNTTIEFGSAIKTLINLHELIFKNVVLGSLINFTMNEFFSGSPSVVTNISSTNINANYTITFQDGFEKIAKFVDISNCTLSRPQQLLVITNSKKSSTNTRGIRYINQSPNGIAKNNPSTPTQTTFSVGGILSDPNMR